MNSFIALENATVGVNQEVVVRRLYEKVFSWNPVTRLKEKSYIISQCLLYIYAIVIVILCNSSRARQEVCRRYVPL